MKPRTLFIFIFILAACGLIVGLLQTELFKPKAQAAVDRKIFEQSIIDPVKLKIRDAQGMELVFNKTDASWKMTKPILADIKKDRLAKIIGMMDGLKFSRVFLPESEDALADSLTGLDQPLWTIKLTGKDGKTLKLFVGRQGPKLGGGKPETYVRPADSQKTFIVDLDISAMLTGDARDYREMTVLEIDPKKFLMLKINGRGSYVLANGDEKTRTYDGRWRIIKPFPGNCDPARVQALIRKIIKIQAERFLDAGPAGVDIAKFGLDKPQLMIELIGKETFVLKLGDRRGESISASLNDEVFFTLPVGMLDELQPALDELRTKTLLPFKADQLDKIEIEREGVKMELVKISTGWKITMPQPGDVEPQKLFKYLKSLASLRIERWIISPDGKPIDIAHPAATITLTLKTKDKTELLTLRIGKANQGEKSVYCRSSVSETITSVNAASLELVMKLEKLFLQDSPITQPVKK